MKWNLNTPSWQHQDNINKSCNAIKEYRYCTGMQLTFFMSTFIIWIPVKNVEFIYFDIVFVRKFTNNGLISKNLYYLYTHLKHLRKISLVSKYCSFWGKVLAILFSNNRIDNFDWSSEMFTCFLIEYVLNVY